VGETPCVASVHAARLQRDPHGVFHVGASVFTRSYCPGMITAVVIYLPLFALITDLAHKEGLLGIGNLLPRW
jgi:uncharacterized protein with HXXEE motif